GSVNTQEITVLIVILQFSQQSHAERTLRILLLQGSWQLYDSKIVVADASTTFLRLRLEPNSRGSITGVEERTIGQIISAAGDQWGHVRDIKVTGTSRNPLIGDIPDFPEG
ncbi:MAG: hypothetical protein NUV56_02075, partial [Candidatus Uhrbacteria bacterium]|nr:hypothetical protein [Candidatus Uhrbacteria bacterium]